MAQYCLDLRHGSLELHSVQALLARGHAGSPVSWLRRDFWYQQPTGSPATIGCFSGDSGGFIHTRISPRTVSWGSFRDPTLISGLPVRTRKQHMLNLLSRLPGSSCLETRGSLGWGPAGTRNSAMRFPFTKRVASSAPRDATRSHKQPVSSICLGVPQKWS